VCFVFQIVSFLSNTFQHFQTHVLKILLLRRKINSIFFFSKFNGERENAISSRRVFRKLSMINLEVHFDISECAQSKPVKY